MCTAVQKQNLQQTTADMEEPLKADTQSTSFTPSVSPHFSLSVTTERARSNLCCALKLRGTYNISEAAVVFFMEKKGGFLKFFALKTKRSNYSLTKTISSTHICLLAEVRFQLMKRIDSSCVVLPVHPRSLSPHGFISPFHFCIHHIISLSPFERNKLC